jgi:hypothetical protein
MFYGGSRREIANLSYGSMLKWTLPLHETAFNSKSDTDIQ